MFNKIIFSLLLFVTTIVYSQDIWVGYRAYKNTNEYNVFKYYTNTDSATAEIYGKHLKDMMNDSVDYEEITEDLLKMSSYNGLVYYIIHIYDVTNEEMSDLNDEDEKIRYVEATMQKYHFTKQLYKYDNNLKFKY